MTSAVTIVLALASRAPVTMMDEPTAGLDVVAREDFYRLLLEDHTGTGRTFVISTHILEEAAPVFERVMVMKEGRLIENCETDALLAQFCAVSGRDDAVAAACEGYEVLHTEALGRQVLCTVRAPRETVAARGLDVDCTALSLQKVFVALCGHEREGAGMKKALWFLLRSFLQMTGMLLLFYAALIVLCLLFGVESFFGVYLIGYSFAFFFVAALCAAQMTAAWCPLALSLGATRRTLRGGVFPAWLALSLLTQAVNMLLNRVTSALFPSERLSREFVYGISRHPLAGFGVVLLLTGASLWTGTLKLNARPVLPKVLLIVFDILIYAQVFVLGVLSTLEPILPAAAIPLYGGAMAALGTVFTAVTLHRLKALAVSQV